MGTGPKVDLEGVTGPERDEITEWPTRSSAWSVGGSDTRQSRSGIPEKRAGAGAGAGSGAGAAVSAGAGASTRCLGTGAVDVATPTAATTCRPWLGASTIGAQLDIQPPSSGSGATTVDGVLTAAKQVCSVYDR